MGQHRDRFAYRPGNGTCLIEALEDRQLMDGSGDLTSLISNLISTQAPSGTYSYNNVALGKFLTIPSVTVGVPSALNSDGSETIKVDVASASVNVGTGLTGTITGSPTAEGLSGSFSFQPGDFAAGAYKLAVNQLDLTVPSVLTASASGVAISYDPAAAPGQTLATIGTASGTITPLQGATIALSNLVVRDNGFSLANATVTAGSFGLGGILQVANPSVTFNDVAYTSGAVAPSTGLTGTITASVDSATLFGGAAGFTSPGGASAASNGLKLTQFVGSYDLASNKLGLAAGGIDLALGKIVDATGTNVTIGYDSTAPSPVTVTAGTVHVTSPLFQGVSLDATNLAVSSAGVSLDAASVTDANSIQLGSLATVTGLTFGLQKFSYTTATGKVAGTVNLGASQVDLFPGHSGFTASVTNFNGSYTLNSNALTLSADKVDVAFGQILQAEAQTVAFGWDGTSATLDLGALSLTSPEFPNVTGQLTSLHADSTGFTVASASLADKGSIKLGGLLQIDGPTITATNLVYHTTGNQITGTIGLTVQGVEVLPGSTAFSSTVTNFAATYDIVTQATTLSADSIVVTVGSGSTGTDTSNASLIVEADTVAFSLTPNAAGTDDSVAITIGAASAQLPKFGLTGGITDLAITNDGFHIGSATLSKTGDVSAFGGKFSVKNPSVALTNFGYSTQTGAQFNSDLTLKADEVDFNKGGTTSLVAAAYDPNNPPPAGTKITPLTATISFTTTNVGDFRFTAPYVMAKVGSYLTLSATGVAIDTAPAAGGDFASFASVTAALNVGGLKVGGTATDFAIDGNGQLATLPGFGVTLNTNIDVGNIKWPSWLPIQVQKFGITWLDFTDHPTDFTLDLSATVQASIGSTVQLGGSVTDAQIDVGLLSQGQFPITSLGGISVNAAGSIGPATVSGSAFFSILNVDANNNPITDGSTTPVARRIFYGGIDAALAIKGAAGFEIKVGLSQYGPLTGFVEAKVPILLDPVTGLSIAEFHAGVEFGRSLPSITDAKLLTTDPAFQPDNNLTDATWMDRLKSQVIAQASTGSTDAFAILRQPMVIDAGATIFSADASQYAFQLAGDVQISTDGKILLSGTLILGNTVKLKTGAYIDFSQVINSSPTKPIAATLLVYAQAPADAPILSLYGSVVISQVISSGVIVPNTINLTITGEADATIPGLDKGLDVVGKASLTANLATAALDLSVSGYATLDPVGQLGSLEGFVHFDVSPTGTPELYGAVKVDAGNIPTLTKLGLNLDAHAFLRFNTTNAIQSATLTPLPTPEEIASKTIPAPITFNIPAMSASLYLNGDLKYKDVFEINAQLYASFTVVTLASGKLDPELDIELSGDLSFGSASSGSNGTADALVSLHTQGLLIVNSLGLAASLTVTVNSSKGLDDKGIDLSGTSLTMVINTTGVDESFTVPAIPNENGDGNAPGTGQSYTISGTPQLPSPNSSAGLTPGPYVLIAGTAAMTIKGFGLNGGFDFLAAYDSKSQAYTFRIDVNAMTLTVPSPTDPTKSLLTLTASGGLLVTSAGIAAALSVTAGGISGTDFAVSGNYTFAVNTTATDDTLGGVLAPANTVLIHIDGDVLVGPSGSQFDVHGSLTLTISPAGFNLKIDGTADLGSFGKLATTDSLSISAAGIKGSLNLSGTVTPFAGTSLSGSFTLKFDTTQSVPDVELDITGVTPGTMADLSVGGGAFDLMGNLVLHVSGSGFHIAADVTLTVMGAHLSGSFEAETYKDSDGSTQFILDAGLQIDVNPDGSTGALGGLNFTISANPELKINTGSTAQPTGFSQAITPQSAEFDLKNAQLNAFGFKASGTLIAEVSSGGFNIEIPKSDPLTISFLSLGSMQIYGYLNSNGTFSITGQVGFDVDLEYDGYGFEVYGGLGATISNTGLAAWFYGGAKIHAGVFGTFTLGEIDAYLSITGSSVHLEASATVLGFGPYSFDDTIGTAPQSPTPGKPGLNYYSVPTTGAAGGTTSLTARIGGSDGTPIDDSSYQWVVVDPSGTSYAPVYSGTDSVTFGAPGTYKVSLYQSGNSQPIKQSNITVIDIPPVIGSLNLNAAYPGGPITDPNGNILGYDTVQLNPQLTATNVTNLTYQWTVTKNGKPFTNVTGANTANPTITPDAPPKGSAPPDNYGVTLTVSDPYGGTSVASGSFNVYNPRYITVDSTLDDWVPGTPQPKDHTTLRMAVEDFRGNIGDLSIPATIHFAPSLAGQTITLTQTQNDFTNETHDSSVTASISLPDVSIIFDGSQAPGITITNNTTTRLFDAVYGSRTEFDEVTLSGGNARGSVETGGIDNSSGGAIYIGGGNYHPIVIMYNSAIINSRAVGLVSPTYGLQQDGHGGAVYIGAGTTFAAYNTTIAQNFATGSAMENDDSAAFGKGGAIYVDGGNLQLVSSTVAFNSVYSFSGNDVRGSNIYETAGSSNEFHNSIIADGNIGYDLDVPYSVSFNGSTNNLVRENDSPLPSYDSNTIQQDPHLGLFAQRNGMWTYSLLPTAADDATKPNPALGTGDIVEAQGAGLITDARGLSRYQTNAAGVVQSIDIGAYERQPNLVTTNNASGPGSLAEAVAGDDDGTPIIFSPLLNGRTIVLTSPLVLRSNITISGPGANLVTISGGGNNQIFTVAAGITAEIDGLTLISGFSSSAGGAISNSGTLTLKNDVLSHNSVNAYVVTVPNALGGAIYNAAGATLNLSGDTFNNNSAVGFAGAGSGRFQVSPGAASGGALYNAAGGTVTATNVTFSGNSAQGGGTSGSSFNHGDGGAIHNAGTMTLTNVTMAYDSASDGAGTTNSAPGHYTTGAEIENDTTGQVTMNNSIVAAFDSGITDATNFGSFRGQSNLIMFSNTVINGGFSAGMPNAGIISTADPKLRFLNNYGGTTPTLIPTVASPVLGQATVGLLPATDQRGITRTNPATGDLGAVQLRFFSVSNTKDSGAGSLRQTILDDVDETPITFASGLAGGIIDLLSPITLSHDTTINGLGASSLTISGQSNNALSNTLLFNIGSAAVVSITGLTMTNGGGFGLGWGDQGGAIANFGTLTLANDVVSNSQVNGSPRNGGGGAGQGGAVYNGAGASLTVTGSLFQNNIARGENSDYNPTLTDRLPGQAGAGQGGAIYNALGGQLTVIDDTFAANSAIGGNGINYGSGRLYVAGIANVGIGGAIDNAGTATIINATVVKNAVVNGTNPSGVKASGDDGAELFNDSTGTLTLDNTIAAYSAGGTEVVNLGKTTGSANLVMSNSGLATGVVFSAVDPRLGLLANNGGPTQTFLINPQSAALGNGVIGVAPSLDQRGMARVVGGKVDIGSYQTQVIPATPAAGGPYTIHVGQALALNGSGTLNPSQSSLNYTWTLVLTTTTGSTTTTKSQALASGVQPTVSWATLNALGVTAANTTAAITLTVDDGYGMNHTVTTQPVALTILPTLQVTATALGSASPAVKQSFDTVDVTVTGPIDPFSLINRAVTITRNGGSTDLAHGSFFGIPQTYIFATLVPGTTSTYRITGLAAVTSGNGQGQYTLTIDGTKLTDAYGNGVGQTSVSWVYDTVAPTSKAVALPTVSNSPSFTVTATGSDPAPQAGVVTSGVASYDLYSQTDGGAWTYWTNVPAAAPSAPFTGDYGHSYAFQSFARDAAGNLETKSQAAEAGTYVANRTTPLAAVTGVDTTRQSFVVSYAGSAANGNTLDHIDVYVAVDGGSPQLVAKSATATGSFFYEATADGQTHTYSFYALGTDAAGNVQPRSVTVLFDQTVTATFAAPTVNAPEALTINHGAPGRSFVRFADIFFDNNAGIADLIAGNHVHLIKHNLDGTTTGDTVIPTTGLLHAVDHAIEIDFGSAGLGGNPLSTAGDGYYEIDIDGSSHAFFFDRLFGDLNGDGMVDATDLNLATQSLGVVIPGAVVDADGTGIVTASDRILIQRAKGHKLGAGLHLDA